MSACPAWRAVFQKVCEDPAEIDHRLDSNVLAVLVEQCGVSECVHLGPRCSIGAHDRVDGVVVERLVGQRVVSPSEPPADPEQFGLGEMLDEPEQRRATRNKLVSSLILSEPVELPNDGLAVIPGQGSERLSFAASARRGGFRSTTAEMYLPLRGVPGAVLKRRVEGTQW
jgi:hypothetical protein